MRIRHGPAVIAFVVAAATITLAQPALADETTTTFTIEPGSIGETSPASADLGAADPGAPTTAQLGAVTVTDERAALSGSWTESVSSTAFTTGGGTGVETVPVANISYWSGPATATTGAGTFTPGQATSAAAQTFAASRTAFSWAGSGNNSATFNPTLIVTVPATAVAGEYTGTVTHSVA